MSDERLLRILDTLDRVGYGHYEARSGVDGDDEIGRIGAALDAMLPRLQSRKAGHQRLAELVARSPVVAFEWRNEPGWPVAYVSDSVTCWGYACEDFLSGRLDFAELIHPEDVERVKAEVADHFSTGIDDYRQIYRLRKSDGQWIWVDDRTWLRRSDDGTVTHIYGVVLDITDQHLAAEALRDANAELETRVAARTAELEAVNRELEAFSYSVSHDLKAPLRGIDGYAHILLEDYADRLDDEGRRLLGNVCRGVDQMHRLIGDMLAYSRLERQTLVSLAVELQPLVEEVANAIDEGGLLESAELSIDMGGLAVCADRNGLAMVLRNLLGNALKFHAPGQMPVVRVSARRDGALVRIDVSDQGIGFDMKYHERIFDIFQRLHRAEDYPGTGVGLAMVKRAVLRMGGRVYGRSTPGEGACFSVELPAR